MLQIKRLDACPFGEARRLVEVGIPFRTADNLAVVNVGIDHFLVAPDAAVVGGVERTEALVKQFTGDGSAQGVEIMLDIEQTTTGFAGVNNCGDWVLPTAIHTL